MHGEWKPGLARHCCCSSGPSAISVTPCLFHLLPRTGSGLSNYLGGWSRKLYQKLARISAISKRARYFHSFYIYIYTYYVGIQNSNCGPIPTCCSSTRSTTIFHSTVDTPGANSIQRGHISVRISWRAERRHQKNCFSTPVIIFLIPPGDPFRCSSRLCARYGTGRHLGILIVGGYISKVKRWSQLCIHYLS